MRTTILAAVVVILGIASQSTADNFRCPNGAIVSTGDRMAEVSVKCDPPSFKSARTESEGGYKGATILYSVDEWTYNEGPNRLMHLLVFRNGVLESVQTLGYGK